MKKLLWKKGSIYLPLPVLMAGIWWMCRDRLELFPLLMREVIIIFGYIAAVGDAREKRIPNQLIGIMLGTWILVIIPQLFLHTAQTVPILFSGLFGGAMAGLVFFTVYIVSRHGLGGGDVKFMTVAGLYIGINSVMPTMLTGSILAAVTGVTCIVLKKMDRKGTLPLVPFLYVGIVLTMLFQ